MYIESPNGHDTEDVPENEVQEQAENQLKDDKWVTVEKKDGETKILTEDDMDSDEQKWAQNFENIKSVTATQKAKGG